MIPLRYGTVFGCAVVVLGLATADANAMSREQILGNLREQAATAARSGAAEAGTTRSIGVFDGRNTVSGRAESATAAPAERAETDRPVSPAAAQPGEPPVVAPEHRIDLRITFETNSAFIRPGAADLLGELCAALTEAPESWTFNIIGHADASGPADVNLRLSAARAREVSRYLQAECGISAGRLETFGLGNTRLLPGVPPVSETNRRVEVSINTI